MIDLLSYVQENISTLTSEQKGIYDQIMHCIDNQVGKIFFLDAPGDMGKTFLIRLLLASIRSKNDISLALASSRIAATSLHGERTTHSALKLPLNMQSTETLTTLREQVNTLKLSINMRVQLQSDSSGEIF